MSDPEPPTPRAMLGRALRLRCPVCGGGKVFQGLFAMHPRCSNCSYVYERESGYFLGSIYVNYGLMCLLCIALFFVLEFAFETTLMQQIVSISAVGLLLPLWSHRYARTLWMVVDLTFDPPKETS